ncbi:MAG: ABC transporter substrate-binding protein [Alkalinema sp. RL_2_19]|nr:ABC transporter substrate-binding protein [Alkalinema sp. RL_2_19]
MSIHPSKNSRRRRFAGLICCFCCGLLLTSCVPAALRNAPQPVSHSSRDASCIQNLDPRKDYFPDKIQITDGLGFQVEYHNTYKIVTIKSPWRDAKEQFRYVLVQCGAPPPADVSAQQIITIPVQRVATLSTTHLPHLEKLGLLDRLVAVNNFDWVYGSATRQQLKRQNIASVGNNATVNIERLLELEPDLITTYGSGDVSRDAHPKLLEAGLKVAINAEYMESTPLGQAEWIKFTSLFFNAEATANQVFTEIKQQYQRVAEVAQAAPSQPMVLTGFNNNGTWYIPGGQSYVAQLLRDAGATYPWIDTEQAGSIPMNFEAVYDRAANADVWLNPSIQWKTVEDIRKADDRYANFQPVKTGQIFANDARVNDSGGNDFWQSGIVNPHLVLSDLVKILHPELLPDHRLFYYRSLRTDATTTQPSSVSQ